MTTSTYDLQASAGELLVACKALTGLDQDHCTEENGIGWSGPDSNIGHQLAAVPADRWTAAMARCAWEILRKYKNTQLPVFGINWEGFVEPPADLSALVGRTDAWKLSRPKVVPTLTLEGRTLVLKAPYDPERVGAARSIPGRRWNGDRKVDEFPLTSAQAVIALATKYGIDISPEVVALGESFTAAAAAPLADHVTVDDDGRLAIRADIIRDDANVRATFRAAVPGVRWDGNGKRWVVPETMVVQAYDWATARKLRISAAATDRAEAARAKRAFLADASRALDAEEIEVPGMAPGMRLMPYQRAGVRYALSVRRALIGDAMGLGKTLQALAATAVDNAFPVVIVAKNTLKFNWRAEITKFFPGWNVEVVSGTKRAALPAADAYIVNYDILADRAEDLIAVGPKALVVDESHYIKNSGTQSKPVRRTQAALELAKVVRDTKGLVLLLSGTPVVNRPIELINQLKALGCLNAFGGTSGFKRRYCGASYNAFGATYNGSSNEVELHELLRQTCMIRRKKQDVLTELPDRRHAEVWLELSDKAIGKYREVEADVVGFLAMRARELAEAAGEDGDAAAWQAAIRAEAAMHLVRIAALKRAAMQAKLTMALEWIDDFLAEDDGSKIILFAEHIEAVETLAERYADNGAVKVRGGVKPEDRQRAVDAFQNNPATRVFVANFEAGKEGLTLTAASDVAFLQLGWTPGGHDQAIDRAYGRVNDPHGATGWYLMAADTIDADIWELLAEKRAVVDAVVDGDIAEDPSSGGSVLGDLVVKLAKRGMERA
jgi:hypothetical protein